MCACECTFVCMKVFMYLRIYVCSYECVSPYIYVYIYIYLGMYVRTNVGVYIPTYVCMYSCTYVCMYICTYVYTYVYAVPTWLKLHCPPISHAALYLLITLAWLLRPDFHRHIEYIHEGDLRIFPRKLGPSAALVQAYLKSFLDLS